MGAELFFPEGRSPRATDSALRSILKWASKEFAALAVPEEGDNFMFDGTSLLIKNIDHNRWFKIVVVGSAGLEQLDFSEEVVAPVAALPGATGDNYQFTTAPRLSWAHESSGNYHPFNWYGDGSGFEIGAGAADDEGSAYPSGLNYIFTATQLRFKDLNSGRYLAPVLVGPVALQQLSYL